MAVLADQVKVPGLAVRVFETEAPFTEVDFAGDPGIHHPLKIDVVDTWAKRAVIGGAYHVWHPEGRAFDAAPLTRVEAAARRAQRFTSEGPTPWPIHARAAEPHHDQPYTLDLRRLDLGKPMPRAEEWITE
jgi:uncharacterized protein (DUF2126 family)